MQRNSHPFYINRTVNDKETAMNEVTVLILAVFLGIVFRWGFKHLPGARWQMLGSIPVYQESDYRWRGINLTYYGVFNAFAYTLATAMVIVLFRAIDLDLAPTMVMIVGVLGICMPASRIIAALVEKKPHTFSVGGATFAGILVTPWIAGAINAFSDFPLPVIPVLSAVGIAYAMGEGVGRLACISFGCCYGRPIKDLPQRLQKSMGKCAFVFEGKTKKIAYAHNLDGHQVVPVQAMTTLLYCGCSLLGMYCFLEGYFTGAFLLAILVTQIWRFFSEFLRNDYRGEGSISAYQIMALLGAGYALVLPLIFSSKTLPTPFIEQGLAALWSPAIILVLQALWIFSFVYTGKSSVTESKIDFRIKKDTI